MLYRSINQSMALSASCAEAHSVWDGPMHHYPNESEIANSGTVALEIKICGSEVSGDGCDLEKYIC